MREGNGVDRTFPLLITAEGYDVSAIAAAPPAPDAPGFFRPSETRSAIPLNGRRSLSGCPAELWEGSVGGCGKKPPVNPEGE